MATIRVRRAGANPPPTENEEERVYTEEDYAVQGEAGWTADAYLPDESFLPDLDAADGTEAVWAIEGDYADLPPEEELEEDYDDLNPLADELLTDEERAELRRSRWQLLAGLWDFAGIILGVAVILLMVMLLVSLLNWLISDVSQSFILLQKNF